LIELHTIQAVIFDLDGTLRHSQPTYNQAFFDIACRLGVEEPPEGLKKSMRWLHYYWAQSPELMRDQEHYGDQVEAFWTNHARLALESLGCTPLQADRLSAEVYGCMVAEFQPSDWVPGDVAPALQTLRSAGYRLAVLSNRSHSFESLLSDWGLGGYFEFALAAGELAAWKPDPQVFTRAVERMATDPGETMYVGDNYYADVLGARQAGLVPVLLDSESIFPEADCPVIHTLGELPGLLSQEQPASRRRSTH
jgi:FMN phosphatase YigB (HAD superfamily)